MDGDRRTGSFIDDDFDFDLLLDDEQAERWHEPATGMQADLAPPRETWRDRRLRFSPDWGRLASIAAVAVVVLFVLGFAVKAILDHRKASSFRDYFAAVGEVAKQSDTQGEELDGLFSQPSGADRAQLVARLERMQERADKLVRDTQRIEAPEHLARTHEWAIVALRSRSDCLNGLRRSMASALTAKDRAAAATAVADANRRCDASDVIWQDWFAGSARTVLSREKVSDVRIPTSDFVTDPEFTSPRAMTLMLERLATAPAGKGAKGEKVPDDGKVRGGELQSVTIVPSGETLSTSATTEVAGSDDLALEVTFLNQGEVQATQIPVTIEMRGDNSEPVEISGVIDRVDPAQAGSVRVPVGEVPTFGEVVTISVTVGPIPGEKHTVNNSASFPVMFRL